MSDSGKKIHLAIAKNDLTLLNLLGPPLHGSTETANLVLELKAGDKVYVRNNISSSSRVHGDSHSYISGYFISE